jgi:transcriptional regulator with XRE-family HTH domain
MNNNTPDPLQMTLGSFLKQRRELMMLTLRQVEEAIGISNAYLSQLENNKIKKPSLNFLYKLGNLYGVELDDLLVAAGIVHRQDLSGSSNVRPLTLDGLTITEKEQAQLMEYLQFLRSKKRIS